MGSSRFETGKVAETGRNSLNSCRTREKVINSIWENCQIWPLKRPLGPFNQIHILQSIGTFLEKFHDTKTWKLDIRKAPLPFGCQSKIDMNVYTPRYHSD